MADRAAGAARVTAIEPGMIARVTNAIRYAMTGKAPDVWFGPLEPMEPVAQESAGRQFDYPVGINLTTQPRADSSVTFEQLRALADNHDVTRLVIETRKDQLAKCSWSVKLRDDATPKRAKEQAAIDSDATPEARAITALLRFPDREHDFATWLRMLLEDLLVIDAPTVYRRQTKGGQLYAVEPIDGATIKRVIDGTGRTPAAPAVAYQQVLKGVPSSDYTSDELLYAPRNVRTHRLYGFGPVEQIIMTVNIALRRQVHQLQYYTDGNIPEMLVGVPATWNVDQIAQFQKHWDLLMTDTAVRRRAKFTPGDMKAQLLRTAPIFDEADEWLTRVVCFAFSISPQPFVKQMNRATAGTAQEAALAEGLAPIMLWVKNLLDRIIAQWLGHPDYEFVWDDDEDIDPLTQAQVDQIYINAGVDTVNEVRERRGKDPIEGGDEARKPIQPGAFGAAAPGDGTGSTPSTPSTPGSKTPTQKPVEPNAAESADPGAKKLLKRRSLRRAY